MEKHTHLILKTGDPGFHGHHDFGIDTASPTDSWQVLINNLINCILVAYVFLEIFLHDNQEKIHYFLILFSIIDTKVPREF